MKSSTPSASSEEPEKTSRLCGGCQLPGGGTTMVTQGVTTWEAASLDSSLHVL